jgi:hypothetical protein
MWNNCQNLTSKSRWVASGHNSVACLCDTAQGDRIESYKQEAIQNWQKFCFLKFWAAYTEYLQYQIATDKDNHAEVNVKEGPNR